MPELLNAYLISNNTYVNNPIEVICNEGLIPQSRSNARITCIYDEKMNSLEWVDIESINCVPPSCNPHPEFQYITNVESFYHIGEIITFTCPNGYRIRTRCVLDEITGFGVWNFNGSCTGTTLPDSCTCK